MTLRIEFYDIEDTNKYKNIVEKYDIDNTIKCKSLIMYKIKKYENFKELNQIWFENEKGIITIPFSLIRDIYIYV